MASFQDKLLFTASTPKLPNINSSSIASLGAGASRKPQSIQWLGPLKQRLDYSLNYSGNPHVEDVEELSKEITMLMIAALQPNASKQIWLDLNHVLAVVYPYKEFLRTASISHYVERLFLHYSSNMEMLFDVPILDSLQSMFPYDIERLRSRHGTAASSPERFVTRILTQNTKPDITTEIDQTETAPQLILPDGRNPYNLIRRGDEPERHFKTKKLTFNTLSDNIGFVATETAANESKWQENESTTVAAIKVDLPMSFEHVSEYGSSQMSSRHSLDLSHLRQSTSPRKKTDDFVSMSGRQAVELFLKHKHLHKVKFIYLNNAKNRHYRPYDLVSVPRDMVNNEHFIFSSFGVLHIYPEGNHSDTLTLADWNKHAVLWNAMQKIPFFRNYLIRKTFSSWLASVKRLRYNRIRDQISLSLIHAVPDFGSSLLHVFRLITELSEVKLLPNKPTTALQYTIMEFESDKHKMKLEATELLDLFFQYCKKVVDMTRQSCFEQLKYYEYQAKQSKPLFCKESIYIQRRKREARTNNLRKFQLITRRIPTFVSLVDQAISVHLVALARTAVTHYVEDLLSHLEGNDEDADEESLSTMTESHVTSKEATSSNRDQLEILASVFATKFVFNRETHLLEMQPSPEKFKSAIQSSVEDTLDLMCGCARSMHVVIMTSQSSTRPGSAPASIGSTGSDPSDVSGRSSISSMTSQSESVQRGSTNNAAARNKTTGTAASGKLTALQAASGLTDPAISPRVLPTKEEDAEGVTTPDMMLNSGAEGTLGMVVGGQGMMGHPTPLDQSKLKDKMLEDSEIVEAIARQDQLLSDAIKQVTSFCDEHNSWLREIRTFASTWNDEVLKKWAGKPARVIEEQLNRIKSWIEQVKNMDRALVTSNRLLYVDCRAPYVSLVPALNSIFKKLIAGAVSEAKHCALKVTAEAKDALKILKNKNTDMRSFAEYARKVTMSQKSKDSMTEKVTYIRSLFEVVRMTYRQLTQDEEKLEEKVKSTWEAFLYQLKDANNFVTNQRPIIMKQLESVFQTQYAKAQCVAAKASEGMAVDPSFDATEVICELSCCIEEFHGLQERLREISRYRESVCGEKYNLVDLATLRDGMEARLNLWKNVSVTGYTIAEWKAVVFKKFTVQNAIDKVQEWQQISSTFVEQLPPNDPVFNSWTETLDDIGKELPLLMQLSSEAMKARHWREVFTGMGETYEADWTFTVEDLLSYKPSQYTSTIKRIYRNANAEFSLEQLLRKIKKKWEERQFQLAKHIYVVQVPRKTETTETTSGPKPQYKNQKLLGLTEDVFIEQENDSETFTLVGVDELLRDVSDSHVTLQGMLQSKHAVEVKWDAEIWSDTLQQIGEIVHLWISCQDKWMYLNKVFNAEDALKFQFPHLAIQWKVVDHNYREFINAMASDPKVLSVMSRLHGQKGWRDLQGDALRRHLVSCIHKEEDMVQAISSLLDNFRAKFPRLYFLCDEDCVRLLGIARQPKALVPYVRKCFSGVKSVTFSLPKALRTKHVQGGLTSLDLELHSHRLQAVAVLGNHKEILAIEPLSAHSDVTVWLKMLEKRIESSLREQLKELIELKLQNDLPSILEALSDVYHVDTTLDETSPESLQYRHWLLSYPSQVVLLANSVIWFKNVEKFVKDGARKADFENLRKETVHQLKQFVQATQDSLSATSSSSAQKRLQSVLSNLTIQTAYHRDVLKSLEKCQVKSINSYEWQSLLKHTANIKDYSNLGVKREEVIEGYPHSDLTKAAIVVDCYVSQLERRTPYGYEYYGMQKGNDSNIGGICAPTVITPITERCMLNLSVAFQLCQVGCVFGPRNVGKSHAVAELARAFGRPFVNLTCSEQLTQEIIKRTLCGLVETGSWLCFDHAQRLQQTTLSQLTHSIKQIQEAYKTVKQSFNTRYTVHGYDASHRIKRSNSVITLHKSDSSLPWQPQVESSFLRSLGNLSYEDSDVRMTSSTYQGHPDLCLALDDKLLTVRDGFGIFMTFATESGCVPTVPDSLKLIYRPTCLIKPDVSKLIEVWLQSAGFSDSTNLTHKLTLAYNLFQANSDRISSDQEFIDPEASQLANVGISTLRSIITLGAKLNTRLQSQQRSRTQSQCDSEAPSGRGVYSPSVTSSSTSVSRSSRRSEMILSSHNEELALVNALIVTCTIKLGSPECNTRLKEMLRPIFPTISRPLAPSSLDSKLAGAIHQQMVTDGFQPASDSIEKACQLFTLLRLNQSVVIAGPAGSGKTTICKILAKALNSLSSETLVEAGITTSNTSSTMKLKSTKSAVSASEMSDPHFHSDVFEFHEGDGFADLLDVDGYGRVDSTTIFPNAHNIADIFGFHKPKSQTWKDGLLVKLLKDCTVIHKVGARSKGNNHNRKSLQPSAGSPRNATTEPELPSLKKWIVLDGEIQPTWSDNISCLLDHHRKERLSNLDEVSIPQSTSFIFELSNFASASPAMASRCAILYCDIADNWRNIALSWLDTAYSQFKVTQSTIRIWRDLVEDLVPPVVHFLRKSSGSLLNTGLDHTNKVSHGAATGVHEMTSFINILSSCLTAHEVVRNTSTQNQDDVTTSKRSLHNSINHDDAQSTRTRASSNRSRLDDSVPESYFQLAMNLFAFSFVWGFGGQLQEKDIPGFDKVVRDAFAKSRHDISFPRYESVFDYFVDEEFGRFSLWEDKIDLRPRALMQNGSQYVPLHQLERYAYLSSVLLHSRKSVLLVGEPGCGKSSLVKNLLQADLDITKISISPGLLASHFQRLIESKALPTSRQHNLGLMAHPNAVIASRNMMSQIALFFLDDLSCARSAHHQGHEVKVQPTLELLRQIITTNGVYELDRLLFKSLEAEIAFVATTTTPGLPGSGLGKIGHTMSPRLTRNFTVLNFLKPSKDAILSMHHSGVQSWLEEFPAYSLVRHYDLSQAIISGAYDLYSSISSHLKPSPTNPHYVFSLHDISHVMQGLFQLTPRTRGRPMPIRRRGANEQRRRPGGGVGGGGGGRQASRFMSRNWGDGGPALPPMMRTVIRLWLHECSRVFHDRLSTDEDRRWFSKTLHDQLKKHFCTSKVDRAPSPDKTRIVKTPVPSGGGGATPLPSHSSSGSLPSSSLGGASDSFFQSSPEQQTGYDGDRSLGSESGDQVGIESTPEADYDVTKGSTIRHRERIPYEDDDLPRSTSYASSIGSANKTSDFYETDETQSGVSKVETSTSSNTAKELHIAIPSASSLRDSSLGDEFSETTTTQIHNESSMTSGDLESRPVTEMTHDDDAKSTMTGYTTEAETASNSVMTMEAGSSDSESSEETNQQRTESAGVTFTDPVPHSSGNPPEKMEKPVRPQHGGGAKLSRPGGAKLGVTFMPGLVDDADDAVNMAGPLVSMEQVLDDSEESTSIIFTHNILQPNRDQKGVSFYAESTLPQLAGTLKLGLDTYNKQSVEGKQMELVFFGQSIRHIARLSRVTSMKQGGHALLLSASRFVGRRSLTRLVAYHCGATFMCMEDVDTEKKTDKSKLRSLIKQASFEAGIQNNKVILLVEEPYSTDPDCLDDVCSLIRDGQCPALYTNKELAKIASEIAPALSSVLSTSEPNLASGGMTEVERLDQYLDTFFLRVLTNLHVVVLSPFPQDAGPAFSGGDSQSVLFHKSKDFQKFHEMLRRCPDLLTRFSCVDLYRSWDESSWNLVAKHYLESYAGLNTSEDARVKLPWSKRNPVQYQVTCLSFVMSFIHHDALERLKTLHPNAEDFANPLIFEQMIQLCVGIARMVRSKEIAVIERYEQALTKVREAEASLHGYYDDRVTLLPRLEDARARERSWKRHVEEERQEYAEARERCAIEEDNIEMLELELEILKNDTSSSSSKVNPLFEAARDAVDALSENSLDEMKRYKSPPESTSLVISCLCHMFKVSPANWETGKALISREGFFQELEYYDKDNIPENIYYTLMRYVQMAEFLPSHVIKGSRAAATLCSWMHAIYKYAETTRILQPILDAQKNVEKKLEAAQITLGTKRVRCNQIKKELDAKIQSHKNASQMVKQLEKEHKTLESRISKAEELMENMQEHVDHWRSLRSDASSRLDSAMGDSALVAATIAYQGCLNVEQRTLAIQQWKDACIHGYVDGGELKVHPFERAREVDETTTTDTDSLWGDIDEDSGTSSVGPRMFLRIRDNFDPLDILSTPSEQRLWHRGGLSRDRSARLDALRLHALSLYQDLAWCLIFDPDDCAQTWLNAIRDKVRKEMQDETIAPATPCLDCSRPPTSSSGSKSESIREEEEGISLSSLSDAALRSEVVSAAETEVTISVSATGTVRSEVTKEQGKSPKGVRFAEVEEEEEVSDEKVEQQESQQDLAQSVEEELPPPSFPLDRLWVCKAIDPDLDRHLASAMLHGSCLLITQVEQADVPHLCVSRKLAAKQQKHPDFRLYLSTSLTPLEFATKSPGLHSLPIHKFASSDLSLNEDGLLEQLEHFVLAQERSEFEAQRRLMEADIFHLDEMMEQLQDNLLSRVANVEGPILADTGMLQAIQTYKKDTETTISSLKETTLMENNLMQKKFDLSFVASHGLRLYEAFRSIATVRPLLYKMTSLQFVALYRARLRSHVRGKANAGNSSTGGSSGALIKSRVVELKQGLTESLLDFAEQRMFSQDVTLLTALVSLSQMVTTGKMTEEEMKEFVECSNTEPLQQLPADIANLHKPVWMDDHIWQQALLLTHRHREAFQHFAWTLSVNQRRWREYLHSPPVLLAKVPCNKLHSLTLGQKALLWKILRPEVFSQTIQDMNASVLGGVAARSNVIDFDEVVKKAKPCVPCCFVLPENPQDSTYLPAIHILEKAKAKRIVCIERSAEFPDDLGETMEQCMLNGHWLLLSNCELATRWPHKFVALLTYMANERQVAVEAAARPNSKVKLSILAKVVTNLRSISTSTEKKSVNVESIDTVEHEAAVHPLFRLWIVTRNKPSLAADIPLQILRSENVFTVETPVSHKDLVQSTHKLLANIAPSLLHLSVASKHPVITHTDLHVPYNVRAAINCKSDGFNHGKGNLLIQLSMLHSTLLERLHFKTSAFVKPYPLTDAELVNALQSLMMVENVDVAKALCSSAMAQQVPEIRDMEITRELSTQCIQVPHENAISQGLIDDIKLVLHYCQKSKPSFDMLLQKPELAKLGLPMSSEINPINAWSKKYSTILTGACQSLATAVGKLPNSGLNSLLVKSTETLHIKRTIESLLNQVMETTTPQYNKYILSPTMMEFYSSEVQKLRTAIAVLQNDLSMCLAAVKGDEEITTTHEVLIDSFAKDQLPNTWWQCNREIFKYHRGHSLLQFVSCLDKRVNLLHKYMEIATMSSQANVVKTKRSNESVHSTISKTSSSTQTLVSYNLSVFLRPDLFLQSVLCTVAKSKHHDPHKYQFKKQFVTDSDVGQQEIPLIPFQSIYIDGLHIHKAIYERRSSTLQQTTSHESKNMPLLCLKAEKVSQYKRLPSTGDIYNCPVWICDEKNPNMFSNESVITHVPIATSHPPLQWFAKGTSLLSKLEDN